MKIPNIGPMKFKGPTGLFILALAEGTITRIVVTDGVRDRHPL